MRTGIKTLFKKALFLGKQPSGFLNQYSGSKLPAKGLANWQLNLELYSLANELASQKPEEKMGGFYCQPHPLTLKVWKKLLKYNPNNLGNWSLKGQQELKGTKKIERNLILMMIKLLGGREGEWEGYMTSGATEANIYSCWVGRKALKKKAVKLKDCLIQTSLTHYSVQKAADIVGIKTTYQVPMDPVTWSVDIFSLKEKIRSLTRKGFNGFLVPLTLGYTQTGTEDGYQEINPVLVRLEKELGVSIFTWLDAATNGLVNPFVKKRFLPLRGRKTSAIIIDFHKAGMCPIPSGLILYRSKLREHTARKVAYLDSKDSSLLGSRSGIAPVAVFFLLKGLGKKGLEKIFSERLKQKKRFMVSIKDEVKSLKLVSGKDSLIVGLITKRPLMKSVTNQYGLYAKKTEYFFTNGTIKRYIYKALF